MIPGTIPRLLQGALRDRGDGTLPLILRSARTSGEVRTDVDAVMLARLTVAAFDGLQLQWLYDKNVDMADGLRQLIDVLLAPPPY
jgi:hypothetical protein